MNEIGIFLGLGFLAVALAGVAGYAFLLSVADAKRMARILLGSFLAVLAGWVACALLILLISGGFALVAPNFDDAGVPRPHDLTFLFDLPQMFLWTMAFTGVFVVPTWLFAFLPCYALIPLDNILWRPPVCTAFGAAVGFGLTWAIVLWLDGSAGVLRGEDVWSLALFGAFTGGVACLVASLTVDRFRGGA